VRCVIQMSNVAMNSPSYNCSTGPAPGLFTKFFSTRQEPLAGWKRRALALGLVLTGAKALVFGPEFAGLKPGISTLSHRMHVLLMNN